MGSAGMSVAITDPREIAAAAPFRTAAALDNSGTAKISAGSVDTPPPNANLQQPVMIAFTDPTHFSVTGTGIPASASAPPYVPYTSGADISYNGWTVQITGAAVAGDTFTVSANTGGTADSRNAVALAALQTKSTMIGGTASYQEAYAQLVSEVGNKASEVSSMATSQQAAADQADSARKSVSGVNLDEEAANLIKYQQAYQASAKVISIASKLFDQILALGQ
jgi:flagellar hook-associated protein 1 FlgK